MLDYGLDVSDVERDLVLPELVAEGDELDALVSVQADWSRATPAAGWTIAHQIAHLASADANVVLAIRTPEAFDAVLAQAAADTPISTPPREPPHRDRYCWNNGALVEPRWRRRCVKFRRTKGFRGTARR